MWALAILPVLIAGIAFSAKREIKEIEADFAEHERTNCARGARHALSERLYPSPIDCEVVVKNASDERLRAYRAKQEAKAKQEAEERAKQDAEWQAFCKRMGVIKYERA